MNISTGIGKVQGTITRSGDHLQIGKNFVDSVTGKSRAWGKITVGEKQMTWRSTMNCVESEILLRKSAKDEGKRITFIQSQGV